MFKTKVTEMLGIEHPIVVGTMMWLSTGEFIASASEAGALGVLASAIYQSKEEFRDELQKVKTLTKKPFAVNINMFPSMRPIKNDDYIDVLLDEGVRIVETSGHQAPTEYLPRLKEAGCTCIHKCVGVKYAKKVASIGVDIVTVVGYENGGASGNLGLGTVVLAPAVVDAVDIPVICGGGVADGRGFLAMLALGASGVIMGTRLLLTEECPIHDNLKNALKDASETDTMLIMHSINAVHRVWINETAKKTAKLEAEGGSLQDLLKYIGGETAKKMFDEGDIQSGIIATGQCIGLSREILPMKDVIEGVIKEAADIRTSLGG
ncbi:NAD(P)H-dependent flavin oxidoreductase [bacterium]